MDFGRRLLPSVVDDYVLTDPGKVYASIPNSPSNVSDGFQDVTMGKLAAIVNRVSWWLRDVIGVGNLDTISYIGLADIRYAVLFLAAVKCRYKMLFISPRNKPDQNERMLSQTGCRALFYGEEVSALTETFRPGQLGDIIIKPVPSLNELLQTPEDVDVYPYTTTFDEARDEICLILHSSGSTGDPKLVSMTHGTFACTDNDRMIPVPPGRSPQNAAQFDFDGPGRFYSCFPPYHLAGVHAYIDLPIFYRNATVIFGPSMLPPSGYTLSEILKQQHVRAFYVPPSIIEEWASEPVAAEQVKQLDFVLYGGGPLSPHVGDTLSKHTNVCQMYGSLEIGQVQLLVPQTGEWRYMEFNPFEEVDMQPYGDGEDGFEMVLHQDPKFALHRSLWHNFPKVKEWRTGDLFMPHPSKPGLWRFHSRADDLIVFSSSYKLRPVQMETIIQGDPRLSGALVVGQGKSGPLLIVEPKIAEPKPGTLQSHENPDDFIDSIWPTIVEANRIAPSYAQISRSRVIVADPKRRFIRAPKGTVVRKLTTKAYADDIEAAYRDDAPRPAGLDGRADLLPITSLTLSDLKEFVRKYVTERLQGTPLLDTDNIFLCGLDSLGAASLSRNLQNGLATRFHAAGGAHRNMISLRLIHQNPTIEKLASVIHSILNNQEITEHSISMEDTLAELTKNLPERKPATDEQVLVNDAGSIGVALIGPRGSLGPNILNELLNDTRVARVYCLNRGHDGKERMRAVFKDLNLAHDVDDGRLSFMPVDLGKPHLGLCPADLDELLNGANVIIHNAWRVDFSWTLDSYKQTYLQSVRELVDLSSISPLRPRIVFVSSVSSVQEWAAVYPDRDVDEAPLESYSYKVSSPLGYGQSKHIAERMLATASVVSGTPVTILRVGQVAGPTDPCSFGGKWSTDEWIPSLAAISKVLKLIPSDIPPIDWVPVDLAGRAIVDLTFAESDRGQTTDDLRVFNVVNPKLSDWSVFVTAMQHKVGDVTYRQLPLTEWVDALVRTDPTRMPESEARSATKILPFFQLLAETAARGVALHPKFVTANAVRDSRTMATMKGIDEELISRWLEQWGI
ncbi:hypothetical protein F5Y17DRAFT_462718 [Xylariaceae sp. FL0594]|nr:hypothetical protein F5Y17DRAFT_462718 [Xylariaceae sp. FL0594]